MRSPAPLRLLSLLVLPVPISLHSLKSRVLGHRGSLCPEPAVALPPDGVADALRTEVALLLGHDLVHHLVPEVALVLALLRVARLLPAELPRHPLASGLWLR